MLFNITQVIAETQLACTSTFTEICFLYKSIFDSNHIPQYLNTRHIAVHPKKYSVGSEEQLVNIILYGFRTATCHPCKYMCGSEENDSN